jgi:hypothetical protein
LPFKNKSIYYKQPENIGYFQTLQDQIKMTPIKDQVYMYYNELSELSVGYFTGSIEDGRYGFCPVKGGDESHWVTAEAIMKAMGGGSTWDEVPEGYNHIAIDEDGTLACYKDKPKDEIRSWAAEAYKILGYNALEPGQDWRTTHIERPRFNWSEAPHDAVCGAVDADGEGYWYTIEPEPIGRDWITMGEAIHMGSNMLRAGEDFIETLEARP